MSKKDQNLESEKLPYVTSEIDGIYGKIKEIPEHFIVKEIPLYNPSGSGNHLYVNFTKKGVTTRDVEKKLGEIFNLGSKKIGSAGMKDKNAITTQTISMEFSEAELTQEKIQEIKEKIESIPNVNVNWLKQHQNKLRKGHLLGNKFTITISDLDKKEKKSAVRNCKKIIQKISSCGLPNFYGEQRFGVNSNNHIKGRDMILAGIRPRIWLERFFVDSYQSYLFNLYLIKRIEKGFFDKLLVGDIAKKHDTGGIFSVEKKNLKQDQKRFDSKQISFTGPIFGKKMSRPSNDSWELEESVIDSQEISLETLESLGIEGTRRVGRIFLKGFSVKECEEGIIVEFELPKGSFATVVLREIMKND